MVTVTATVILLLFSLGDRQIEEEKNRMTSLRHKTWSYIHASCIQQDPWVSLNKVGSTRGKQKE